jgi:hypothetical protein
MNPQRDTSSVPPFECAEIAFWVRWARQACRGLEVPSPTDEALVLFAFQAMQFPEGNRDESTRDAQNSRSMIKFCFINILWEHTYLVKRVFKVARPRECFRQVPDAQLTELCVTYLGDAVCDGQIFRRAGRLIKLATENMEKHHDLHYRCRLPEQGHPGANVDSPTPAIQLV